MHGQKKNKKKRDSDVKKLVANLEKIFHLIKRVEEKKATQVSQFQW